MFHCCYPYVLLVFNWKESVGVIYIYSLYIYKYIASSLRTFQVYHSNSSTYLRSFFSKSFFFFFIFLLLIVKNMMCACWPSWQEDVCATNYLIALIVLYRVKNIKNKNKLNCSELSRACDDLGKNRQSGNLKILNPYILIYKSIKV